MPEIKKFAGLRTTESPERLNVGELTTGLDIDITNSRKALSRRGFVQVNATALHSLYSNHRIATAVNGTSLVSIATDWSLTTLRALSTTAKVSYETLGDTIYYSNGTDVGRIVGSTPHSWGVTPPVGQPVATETVGALPPGRYLYAITFVRSDGHESGTGVSGQIDITHGGITFTRIEVSTNPDVVAKQLYLSATNGEILYQAALVPNALTAYTYNSDQLDLTIPLTTQFAGPPPAGTLVREYNGVVYVVSGSTVYYSDAYEPELFRQEKNFLQFPGRVVLFEAVNDGIYVGTADAGGDDAESTGSVWFLAGGRPDKFVSSDLFDYGAIENTTVRTDASYFETEQAGETAGEQAYPIVIWSTRHGACVGRNGGAVSNLTEAKYSFPTAQRGAAFIRQDRGYVSYVVTLQGYGERTNAYVIPT